MPHQAAGINQLVVRQLATAVPMAAVLLYARSPWRPYLRFLTLPLATTFGAALLWVFVRTLRLLRISERSIGVMLQDSGPYASDPIKNPSPTSQLILPTEGWGAEQRLALKENDRGVL